MMKMIVKTLLVAVLVMPFMMSCKNDTGTNAETETVETPATVTPAATDQSEGVATAASNNEAPAATTPEAGTTQPANAKAADPKGPPAKVTQVEQPNRPTTSIKFDNIKYDWGTVKQGDAVNHTFKFTNTGKNPLIISNAKASCGCTVPDWTKDPIAPGKTGEIKVKFDSAGKSGQTNKTVTVTANTEPENTVLTISGKIDVPAGGKSDN